MRNNGEQLVKKENNGSIEKTQCEDVDIFKYYLENDEYFKKEEKKEKVLEEDKYLEYLERIINRDYYPENKYNKEEIPDKVNIENYILNFTSDELESLKKVMHNNSKKTLKKFFWMYKKEFLLNKQSDNNSMIKFAKYVARNNLFFPPKPITNRLIGKKRINNPEIVRENTRLPEGFIESIQLKEEKQIKKEIIKSIENSDDYAYHKLLNEDTIKENDNRDIPVFTWGEIASTPKVINESRNSFTVQATPQRETLANELINKYKKKEKPKKESVSRIGVRINSELTPGGLRLLNSIKRNNLFFSQQRQTFSTPNTISKISSIRITKKTD